MNALFVDTAGWMMLADASDPDHARVCAARDGWLEDGGLFVSTDFVMDETFTLLRVRLGLSAAKRWWEMIAGSTRVIWEPIDPRRQSAARAWFFRWKDKAFSFTDCTSFVVMRERRLTHALTSDRHFKLAGFQLVPRRS